MPCIGKVLLAEDSKTNQELIKHFVEETGVEVVIVENGQEAVDYVNSHEVDLVLMDMRMPVMNGVEATKALRSQGFTLPIYALTAENNPAKLHEYVEAGCNHCLTKPIDVPELHRVIKENVGR